MVVALLIVLFLGVALGGAGMRRLGRAAARVTGPWRTAASGISLILIFGGAALAARGALVEGALLALTGAALVLSARRRARRTPGAGPGRDQAPELSLAEARDVLGLGPGASATEIDAAYRRLMRRAHPDAGGTDGLARRLIAARDRLKGAPPGEG